MPLADSTPEKERQRECKALQAVADVLRRNSFLWNRFAPVNFSFQRFCDEVNWLQRNGSEVPSRADPDAANRKADVLLRMLERMNTLYDFLEDPKSDMQHVVALLPSRSTLPMDDAGVLAFCREVHTRLLPLPGATTVRGGFASRMRNLNASFSIYAQFEPSEDDEEKANHKLLSAHVRRRDHCLHLLLTQVDVQMPKYAEHIAFQDAYYKARLALMRVTVEARKAYFRRTMPWLAYDTWYTDP